jgi:hypothetical protein
MPGGTRNGGSAATCSASRGQRRQTRTCAWRRSNHAPTAGSTPAPSRPTPTPCAPTWPRRWTPRWTCWPADDQPTTRCTSSAPRCCTKTASASTWPRLPRRLQLTVASPTRPPWQPPPARPAREPLWMPAQHGQLGGGRRLRARQRTLGRHEVAGARIRDRRPGRQLGPLHRVRRGRRLRPPRAVDRCRLGWLQAARRRAPRDVEQLRGGVLVMRQGRTPARTAGQPVRCTSAATRPRPGAAGPAAGCRPNPNGNWPP